MNSSKKKPEAFTLIELIIGMTVLTIVMIAVGLLTITSIRANQANIDNLTAYYLAQEGIEGLRNVRDSNWMQNHGWNVGGTRFWGSDFDEEGFYTIGYDRETDIPNESDAAPWVLTKLEDEVNCDEIVFEEGEGILWGGDTEFPQPDSDTTLSMVDGFYGHDLEDGEETKYSRYLLVCYTDEDEDILEVTMVVFWTDRTHERAVMVSSQLTDWREGPL